MKISTKRRVPYVGQMIQTECGLCCCAMILRYYKSKKTLFEIRQHIDIGRDGATLGQLKTLFEEEGFQADIYSTTVEGLKKLNVPAIIYWNNEHYVVFEGEKNGKVRILDPNFGRMNISLEELEKSFSKYVLIPIPTENFIPQKKKSNNEWQEVFNIVLKKKKLLLLTLILSTITYLLSIGVPMAIQEIIDNIVQTRSIQSVSAFVLGIVCIAVFYCTFIFFRGMKYITLNLYLSKELNVNTFSRLMKLPYQFFEVRSSGDLLYRLSTLNGIRELISTQLVGGIIDIGSAVFIFFYMLNKSVQLTLLSTIIFAANISFLLITKDWIRQSIDNELTEQSKAQGVQVEALYSISSIKLAGMEKQIFDNWNNIFDSVLSKFKKRSEIQNLYNTVTNSIQLIAPLVILIGGLFIYLDNRLTIGEVIAFQTLASTFFGLSTSIFNAYTQYILVSSYLERINDIYYSEIEKEPENPIKKEILGNIEVKNISFSYTKNSPKVIKNVSMNINKGEQIAIVGISGSGKSTLSKILVGLYTPSSGEILYDGVSIKDFDRKTLCRQMGIVPQDINLFNKSIYKNIVMNREDISIEKVEEVAKAAGISEEIERMPMKYNTIISEMGMNLSGGQRQRIAIARALINKPKILILDEATSSLDSVNESNISKYLDEIGCTRIVIAHRLSTIVNSDKIFVLDDGQIVETGTHEELLRLGGVYTTLYNHISNE